MPNTLSRLWPEMTLPADAANAEPLPRARVLVVDDVPSNLFALRAVLEPLGQELVLAHSGDEALKHLLQGDFALIVMDVQMPGLDGLETAALIRARERTRHIPIIFVTALSREAAHVMKGYEQGAVDYLLKPVDPDILRSKVQVFVDLYQRGKLLERQAVELAERRRHEAELMRAAELEQQLVGIVGHDIRNPLNAILATAQTQLAQGALAPAQHKAFERVQRGGERIEQIVALLLDFTRARIGNGLPVVRSEGDLGELVRRVVDEFHAAHPQRALLTELPEKALRGDWDFDRLAQVLANLVDNALKYSPAHGTVRVRLLRGAGSTALLEVHNDGTPIPEALLPQLFEPFRLGEQSDATVKKSLGLGLYIAKEIVRAHAGSISVRSSAPEGTTFRVCLPCAPEERAACVPVEAGLPLSA
ncbi:MAG TPA: hybrid sensor histidine kinase/response regulator [Aggregicoccus sp.]|nr:hybrid sensor histidine kinase/response regulator [Aggregicoccus sp.]